MEEEVQVTGEGATEAPPATSEDSVEVLDFGGRQVPVVHEAIRGLYEDWQHQTRRLQELGEIVRQQQALIERVQQLQSQQTSAPSAHTPTPEDIQAENERLYQLIVENPREFVANLRQQIRQEIEQQLLSPLSSQVQEIILRQQFEREAEELAATMPDYEQLAPVMSQLIDEMAQMGVDPPNLRFVYELAKGRVAQTFNPDTLLQDPNFRQRVLQDQTIRSEFMKQLASQNQGVPRLIGADTGQPVLAPAEKPRTLKEATRAALAALGVHE